VVGDDIMRYQAAAAAAAAAAQEEASMPDILVRDLPDDVLAAIDARARRVGLSRTEYIRRALARERGDAATDVSVDDLERFTETFSDLADPDLMRQAWS
jgi:Antitoxin FitA-like, ribbon-helix-helix